MVLPIPRRLLSLARSRMSRKSSDMEQEDRAGVGTCAGPAGIDAARPQGPAGTDAARAQRMCFMAGCVSCQGVTVVVASGSQPRKCKRRQKRELPPGHSKRSLREEVEIDTRMRQGSHGHPARHAERCAVFSVAFLRMAQPTLSAFDMIG